MQRAAGLQLRAIGNHDPLPLRTLKEMGFNTKSGAVPLSDQHEGRLIILQPRLDTDPQTGKPQYSYNPGDINRLLCDHPGGRNAPDLVISHWSLDRLSRGYKHDSHPCKGYNYHDRSEEIMPELSGRALGLAGHEHRANFKKATGLNVDTQRFIVIPSISQYSINNPRLPCGIFAEITDDGDDNSLRITFKKVCLGGRNRKSQVTGITPTEVTAYYRPVGIRAPV
jgi:hypothetical protein